MPDSTYAIEITKIGHPTVRIGPFPHHDRADSWAATLTMLAPSSAPVGTAIHVVPYNKTLTYDHDPANISGLTVDDVALLVRDALDGDGTGSNFPDLFDRLVAANGHDRASKIWNHAGILADHWAEQENRADKRSEIVARVAESDRARPRITIGNTFDFGILRDPEQHATLPRAAGAMWVNVEPPEGEGPVPIAELMLGAWNVHGHGFPIRVTSGDLAWWDGLAAAVEKVRDDLAALYGPAPEEV